MANLRSEAEVIAEVGADPVLASLAAKAESPCWLVGGAVRDRFLGLAPDEVDVAIEGDLGPLVSALGGAEELHGRFGTARVRLDGRTIDLARTRRESYEHPGALPVVEPAPIRADLGRRDFTVNAIAISLGVEPELIDPYEGRADLEAGLLRVLHERSFADDPTRALRAARYAARLGFELEPESAALLAGTDLGAVSDDRREAELLRLAAEPDAVEALALLAEWRLIDADRFDRASVAAVAELCEDPRWSDLLERPSALLAAALAEPFGGSAEDAIPAARELAALEPAAPSQALAAARHRHPHELALARALGAEWLDRWAEEWRHVRLGIDGDDLLAEGVVRGPAVGVGLEAALAARLDGEAPDATAQLEVALAAVRSL